MRRQNHLQTEMATLTASLAGPGSGLLLPVAVAVAAVLGAALILSHILRWEHVAFTHPADERCGHQGLATSAES